MNLADSISRNVSSNDSPTNLEFYKNVDKLAEILRKSKEPLDYFSISELFGFNLVVLKYARYQYSYPERAKRHVSALLIRYPGEFELTKIAKKNKKGVIYHAPAVQHCGGVV